jgi:hypothetical protein
MSEGPFANTDREIWRQTPDDYYSPSIHVTAAGSIGMNVGGKVIVLPAQSWHTIADGAMDLTEKFKNLKQTVVEFRSAMFDIIRRIGPAASPEWIRENLERVIRKLPEQP